MGKTTDLKNNSFKQWQTHYLDQFFCSITPVKRHKAKIKALFYKLLISDFNDPKKRIPKLDLIKRCKRATPCERAKYLTSSRVMKIVKFL